MSAQQKIYKLSENLITNQPPINIRICICQFVKYIQNQINKIRDSVEDRQSRTARQTVNKVSRRKSTAKAKLKVTSQEERIHL